MGCLQKYRPAIEKQVREQVGQEPISGFIGIECIKVKAGKSRWSEVTCEEAPIYDSKTRENTIGYLPKGTPVYLLEYFVHGQTISFRR